MSKLFYIYFNKRVNKGFSEKLKLIVKRTEGNYVREAKS